MTAIKSQSEMLARRNAYDRCWAMAMAVHEAGQAMDNKWGVGRLPRLVGVELAGKFASQRAKFSQALIEEDPAEVEKHGAAMERAFAALDRIATEKGHAALPDGQWEFTTPDGLIVLIRDRSQLGQVVLDGRAAQVWSVDEIAEVVSKFPTITVAKNVFPGAEVERVTPVPKIKQQLSDSLEGLPFA